MPAGRALVVLALVLSVPVSSSGEGASTEVGGSAADHFRRGTELYAEGRYQEALPQFEQAHQLAPHPSNLFNMARCHQNLGDTATALGRYREALEATEDPAERQDIERRIQGILARPVRVFVTSTPPGATVLVDAREEPEEGTTPLTLEVTPGPHRLLLTADGFVPTPHRLVVEVGQDQPVQVDLPRVQADECPASAESPEQAPCPSCQRVAFSGLHAHVALTFPIGIPAMVQGRDAQLIAGVGVRAHLTHNSVIFGGRLNLFPIGQEVNVVENEAGGSEEQRTRFTLVHPVLEAGYAWALEVASLWVTGGMSGLLDVQHTSSGGGSADVEYTTSVYGWAAVGLDVYALSWLSIGIDGGIGIGGSLGEEPAFGLFVLLEARLAFHI